MPANTTLFTSTASNAIPDPPRALADETPFECYCGLGPACPMFRQMSAAQRADCTRDKRQTAQWMYVNGMTE
jgi:hypothetical protein